MMAPDTGRRLRFALAAIWLLDAALQYQPFMFTRAFGQTLAATANGNPLVIADPVTWSAGIVEHHPAATNAAFATIQLLIAVGIVWRPAVKAALAASVAWSVAVWWLGEGLGGVLTGDASPWTGAPGAVILYALLAVLLWPGGRDASASFVAGRPLGRLPARLLWLTLWASMAFLTLQTAGMASPGEQTSAFLALVFDLVAVGIFLPAPYARVAVIMAAAAATAIWVVGENFGAMFTGTATDPNSGLLLVLLAVAYWPARTVRPRGLATTLTVAYEQRAGVPGYPANGPGQHRPAAPGRVLPAVVRLGLPPGRRGARTRSAGPEGTGLADPDESGQRHRAGVPASR